MVRVIFSVAILLCFAFGFIQTSQGYESSSTVTANPRTLISSQGICPALSYFLGLDNNGLKSPIINNSNYCSMIQETACTTEDFEGLRQWWEEPVTYSGKRFSKNDSNTVKISHSNSIP